ncbi:MAG: F0F1 ATP synthase subunit delta [Chlorobia bacterium]|nr:F0F1 ATP synthase subunit delta [Fimbriimonadaceae bacterium]
MSSANVFRGDVAHQSFAALLPTVVPSALQIAVRKEGRGGRTANEIEQLKQVSMNEGYDEGYSRGLELGLNEGLERAHAKAYDKAYAEYSAKNDLTLLDFSRDLDLTVASVLKALEDWTHLTEQKLTDIVTEIARSVIAVELQSSRDAVFEIVRQAISEVTHSDSARIRLNPWDAKSLSDQKANIIAAAKSIRTLEFVEDPEISGGCIIETEGGIIDATIDGKLRQLDDELDEAA